MTTELDELFAKIKRQLDFAPTPMYNDVVGLLEYISKSLPHAADVGSFMLADWMPIPTQKFVEGLIEYNAKEVQLSV